MPRPPDAASTRAAASAFTTTPWAAPCGDRLLDPQRVDVEREHLRARGLQQPARDLADEAAPDDPDALAHADVREADPVEGDRGDRGHRGDVEPHLGGHDGAQVDGHADDLGVARVAAAGARDAVARPEAGDRLPHLDHDARRAVADGRLLGELLLDGCARRADPLASCPVDHLAHQVGPLARLAEQRLLRELHAGALGAGADHRERIPHEHGPGRACGLRDVADDRRPASILKHLFHRLSPVLSSRSYSRARAVSSTLQLNRSSARRRASVRRAS